MKPIDALFLLVVFAAALFVSFQSGRKSAEVSAPEPSVGDAAEVTESRYRRCLSTEGDHAFLFLGNNAQLTFGFNIVTHQCLDGADVAEYLSGESLDRGLLCDDVDPVEFYEQNLEKCGWVEVPGPAAGDWGADR